MSKPTRNQSPLLQVVLLLTLGACAPVGPLSNPASQIAQRAQSVSRVEPLSGKAGLPKAAAEAQHWSAQAELVGVYALQLNGEPSLSYEYQTAEQPADSFFVKLWANGAISSRQTPAQGRAQAIPVAEWQLSAQQALQRARAFGFQAQDNFGVGLNYWQGMGIPTASLKWSILSFADPEAQDYFVVDAGSGQVWRCQPTTQPDQGCAPAEQRAHLQAALQP